MEAEPFEVTISTRDDVCIVNVSGEIDMATVPEFMSRLAPAETTERRRWVVDITAVSFVDSAGLRAFVKAHNDLEQRGVEFRLVVPELSAAHRVLEITGLLDELNVVTSIEKALA